MGNEKVWETPGNENPICILSFLMQYYCITDTFAALPVNYLVKWE